jgi:hypothetical protein
VHFSGNNSDSGARPYSVLRTFASGISAEQVTTAWSASKEAWSILLIAMTSAHST